VLVGHSRAGIVISRAVELAPERFVALVYLAAFLVDDGQTLESVMRQIPQRAESAGSLELSADGSSSRIAPGAVQRVFYNTSPPELVERARERSGPEPMASFTTPLSITRERWESVPRYYIECTQDRAIAPELQRQMQDRLPCERTFTMNTDHSPFYSAPAELSEHLLEIAGLLQARAA
jgi:pimeloyl-ACP methyl ester carboxylesterase